MIKTRIITLALVFVVAAVTPVLAYMFWFGTARTYIASGVVLNPYQEPTLGLGFYWDENCTQLVATFDFGENEHLNYGVTLWKFIYIRNEGDVRTYLEYNSTLSYHYPDTTGVSDDWTALSGDWGAGPNLRNLYVEPGVILLTYYKIRIPAYATASTYNWTLTAWGEYWY